MAEVLGKRPGAVKALQRRGNPGAPAMADALVRLVVATRLVVPDAIVGVAPGASVDAKRLNDLVDIDLVFTDAPSAYRELDRLMRLRG